MTPERTTRLLPTRLPTYSVSARTQSQLATFISLMALLVAIVLGYSLVFHLLMAREGQHHSWLTGLYWTLQTMSTLGYGDIAFTSDLGRMYSLLVLTTGITILFVFLPFTLIQFFYAPWLESRAASRAPRELPVDTSDHVILTAHGAIERALIERLTQFRTPYVVLVREVPQALALHDQGVHVMVGQLDDADTYRRARVDRAALVATTQSDAANANIALTIRQVSPTVPIVATAAWENSVAVLQRAGCQQVIQLGEMLGRSMALRIAGQDGRTHVVAQLDELLVAETAAANTSLVGHTLRELGLRDRFNLTVAGVWERGRYVLGGPDAEVKQDTVLLLSGTRAELDAYDREVRADRTAPRHAVVIGGGRVGREASRALAERGIEHRVIEQDGQRLRDQSHLVLGDATDPEVLRKAGLDRADSVAVTTRDDDVNVYVTLCCRQLRPDIQILSRATNERNVATLYQAGADVVLSYFPMEANAIFGVLRQGHLLLLAEGLDVFTVPVPRALAGRSIAESKLRHTTGCTVLAIRPPGGVATSADPMAPLEAGAQIILVGDRESARKFFATYDQVRTATRLSGQSRAGSR